MSVRLRQQDRRATGGPARLDAEPVTTREDASRVGCCRPISPPRVGPAEAERCAALFRALSDPTRVRILALLAAQDEALCVCDIVSHFLQGQPTISHHLGVLRSVGLVEAERRGQWVYYRVNPRGVMEAWRGLARLVP
ncbi:MAG TPA: metalloregulator ArsR/SmtB family transcription factor [Thermaerobacter sp.]